MKNVYMAANGQSGGAAERLSVGRNWHTRWNVCRSHDAHAP